MSSAIDSNSDAARKFALGCQLSAGLLFDARDPLIIIGAIHAAIDASPFNLAAFEMRRLASALARFSSHIVRLLDHRPWTTPPGRAARDRAGQVVACILAGHTTGVTLASIATHLDVGAAPLSEALNRYTGHAFAEHVNVLRVVRALALLSETREEVGLIARRCGYPTPAQLDAWFQRLLRVTPRRFRQLVNADRPALYRYPT